MINLETGKTVIELTEAEIDMVMKALDCSITIIDDVIRDERFMRLSDSATETKMRYENLRDTIEKQREESK